MYVEKSFGAERYDILRTVESPHEGMRLDQFVSQFMETLSREFIIKKIKRGEIKINNRLSANRPSTRLHIGDIVSMTTHRKGLEDEYWKGEKIEMNQSPEIIFENSDLLIFSKPPFMSTHPTGRHLFYCATVYAEQMTQSKVYGVHRLDRETSGIMVFAKTLPMAQKLTLMFEQREIHKAYFLISKNESIQQVPSFFKASESLMPGKVETQVVDHDSPLSKNAFTSFHLLYTRHPYFFFLALPKTGRQHQIRAHANHHHFPLLGDKTYPNCEVFKRFKDHLSQKEDYEHLEIPRQALHAFALSFQEEKKKSFFFASFPQDLKNWMKDKNIDEKLVENLAQEKVHSLFN